MRENYLRKHNINLSNARYSKINIDAFSTSKTTMQIQKFIRKDSFDYEKGDTFKILNKFLPKIESSSRITQISCQKINMSTQSNRALRDQDIYSQAKKSQYLSQKRGLINSSKFVDLSDLKFNKLKNFHVVSKQGKRQYNEDRFVCKIKNNDYLKGSSITLKKQKEDYDLYCIFDGHGGSSCAQYLKDSFALTLNRSKIIESKPEEGIKETFNKLEEKFLAICQSKNELETSGSCAVVCLVYDQKIYVANLGDSRALLLNNQNFIELTKDHKPHDISQKMRILKHGGKIYREQEGKIKHIKIFRQMRVIPGNLNVTRTIGDIEVKVKKYGGLPGMISSEPQIRIFERQSYDVLLLGSDGLFEGLSNEQVHKVYLQICGNGCKENMINLVIEFIEELAIRAENKSGDNITIIGVLLTPPSILV